jgi:4-oxalmesaconate hydratase
MIIDCHGHYTVLPAAHDAWREQQKAAFKAGEAAPAYPPISDAEIRETIEANQLRLIKERGADLTVFSPRASAMAPHVGDQTVAVKWAQVCNDLIARVVGLFPETFVGVCMLPQSPEASMASSIAELRRCVDMGFIGCNLNPDPGGGYFRHPPLTDAYWFPFYEAMCELDVPAMIHVSGSCNPAMHATGGYRFHAIAGRRSVQPLPNLALHHPARGRRGALPLGAVSGPGRHAQEAGLADPSDEQRVFRHLRLSPAGRRSAGKCDRRQEHLVR